MEPERNEECVQRLRLINVLFERKLSCKKARYYFAALTVLESYKQWDRNHLNNDLPIFHSSGRGLVV